MKILLADLAHTYSVEDSSLTVPLSLGYIKAYAAARFDDAIDIRLFKHPERFLAAAHETRPDIVGLANYGWNENLNRTVGRYLRAMLPDSLLIAGGPNIDPDPRQQLAFFKRHDYLDLTVADGGEETFSDLIEWWRAGERDMAALPMNVIHRDGGRVVATEARPLGKQIMGIESPYLGGCLDEFLDAGMMPMFESNRGCPFKCTFCAWGSASKDLVRRFDIETTLAEIEYVGERSRARSWIFCDANFGILKRDVKLARAIRRVRDKTGLPKKCHIWLAKNATERNLDIGEILGDMTLPTMAVQSLDDAVLQAIKRDNISTDTYVQFQQRFHKIGSRTYSDLIVPLPNETLSSHLDALRQLISYGVDVIANHNMRLLAGAETNSLETWDKYGFRSRYRLIHGDAGEYRAPDGIKLQCFEYEESLRETHTMSEQDLFFLRKLHFLIDFSWNIEVYKPLLKFLLAHGEHPVDLLMQMVRLSAEDPAALGRTGARIAEFFREFDRQSTEEWFDDAESIEAYFLEPEQFAKLLGQEYEKLNILFSIVLMRDFKQDFDEAVLTLAQESAAAEDLLRQAATLSFAVFPQIDSETVSRTIRINEGIANLLEPGLDDRDFDSPPLDIVLSDSGRRDKICALISRPGGKTFSKILNTQEYSLRDLRLKSTARPDTIPPQL